MIKLKINNETDMLKEVIVGISNDMGGVPSIEDCYDPKSKQNVLAGTYPHENDCAKELFSLVQVLEKYDVKVYYPDNIKNVNQIFTRDIAFVVDDKIVLSNVIINRSKELYGINRIMNDIPDENIIILPKEVRVEGGDVILCDNFVFVGYSEEKDFNKYQVSRTNRAGLEFLQDSFPNKEVKGFELTKSDNNPRENSLHLDCCFQPIGSSSSILYKKGFKNKFDVDFIVGYFGVDNIIEITKEEMYNMNSNIFSISEDIVISEESFSRVNSELWKRGFVVEEVPYSEIAKMEGLLRCSTLPLSRKVN